MLVVAWLAVSGLATVRTTWPKSVAQNLFFAGAILALATLLVGPFVRANTPISQDSWLRESLYGASWSLLGFAQVWPRFRERTRSKVRALLLLFSTIALMLVSAWWQRCFLPFGEPFATHVAGVGVSRWLHTVAAIALASSLASAPKQELSRSWSMHPHIEKVFAVLLLLLTWLRPEQALFAVDERVALMCALLLMSLGEARALGIERAHEISLRALTMVAVGYLLYAASAFPGTASSQTFESRLRWVSAVWISSVLALSLHQWLTRAWSSRRVTLQNAIATADKNLLAATDVRGFAESLLRPLAEAVHGEATLVWRAPAVDDIRIQRVLSFTASRLGDCQRAELSVEHAALSMFDLTQRARTGSRATTLAMLLPLGTRRPELRAGLIAAQTHNWQTWMELCGTDGICEALVLLSHGQAAESDAQASESHADIRSRMFSFLRRAKPTWSPLPTDALRDLDTLAELAERALAIHARTERALLREHHALTRAALPPVIAPQTSNIDALRMSNGVETPATSIAVSAAMKSASERRKELAAQTVSVYVHGSDDERVMEWVLRLRAESEQRSAPLVVIDLLHMPRESFDLADTVRQAGSGTLVLRHPSMLSNDTQDALGNAIATGKLRGPSHDLQPTALRCRVLLVSPFSADECNLRARLRTRVAILKVPTLAERSEDVESIVLLFTHRYGRALGRELHWSTDELAEIAKRSTSVSDLERNVFQKLRIES